MFWEDNFLWVQLWKSSLKSILLFKINPALCRILDAMKSNLSKIFFTFLYETLTKELLKQKNSCNFKNSAE